jgi:hypothetical protein
MNLNKDDTKNPHQNQPLRKLPNHNETLIEKSNKNSFPRICNKNTISLSITRSN